VKTSHMIAGACNSGRLICLSILFAGSSAIVFAAISFVRTARLHGMTTAQAASFNAPTFLIYSKIVLAVAVLLAIVELTGFFLSQAKLTLAQGIRYGAEALCIAATLLFSVVIAPAMEKLMPQLAESASAYAAFHELHHWSEIYFGCMILFALIALLTPALRKD